jgi:hypothetical protein
MAASAAPMRSRLLLLFVSLLVAGCRHSTVVGSTGACATASDCTPPSTICSSDGQCVPGCAQNPTACLGGSCDPASGECQGGPVGKPCAVDGDCAPPDLVCRPSTKSCVAGCGLDPGACQQGWRCNVKSGRCCDPAQPGCDAPADAGGGCDGDDDCALMPGTICQAGACVPSCASTGCAAPLVCGANGHCGPTGGCQRDDQCDPGSYCAPQGACMVLPAGGRIDCAMGVVVETQCNQKSTPAAFLACVGSVGPADCPYCTEGSCYRPGLCAVAADCHHADTCTNGLCIPTAPQCPSTVTAASVVAGAWATGREVCVRDTVTSGTDAFNGDVFLRLGAAGLPLTITPLYLGAGVTRPSVGATISARGVVRWDKWHTRFELDPVQWWQ